MNRILLFSTLAAAGLALSVSACDEQQASDSSSVPMQQQGAVPSDSTGSAAPIMPAAEEPQAQPSDMTGPQPAQPATTQPDSSQ